MKKNRNYSPETLPLDTFTVKEQCKEDKVILVNAQLNVPQCTAKQWAGCKRFNHFYREMAEQRLRYARTALAKQARKRFSGQAEDAFFVPSVMEISYHVVHNGDGYLSLCYDLCVSEDGQNIEKVRYADTWSFQTGYTAVSLLAGSQKRAVLKLCQKELRRREEQKPGSFFPNARVLLRREYRDEQSYLGEGGVGLFYQLSAVAPRSHGFVAFEGLLPIPDTKS